MRTWKEKTLSALLSAVMLLSLIPAASIPARAAAALEKPDVDVSDTGKYFDAGIGKGASQAHFVNGAFGDAPTVGGYDGKLVSTDRSVTVDVSTYNMMNCFGMYRKGSEVSAPVSSTVSMVTSRPPITRPARKWQRSLCAIARTRQNKQKKAGAPKGIKN